MSVYNLSCLQFLTKEEKLIWLYLYICGARDRELFMHCKRMSNNYAPKFSDAELITTYLFAIIEQKSLTIKSIHRVISRYWQSWFPEFPSYQKYAFRLNRLSEVFPALVERVRRAASIAGVYQQVSCCRDYAYIPFSQLVIRINGQLSMGFGGGFTFGVVIGVRIEGGGFLFRGR